MDTPLHNLVIRTITEYLPCQNKTLVALHCVSKRFYGLRDIFIGQLVIKTMCANYAIKHNLYGWNKCHSLYLYGKDADIIVQCGAVYHLEICASFLNKDILTALSKV